MKPDKAAPKSVFHVFKHKPSSFLSRFDSKSSNSTDNIRSGTFLSTPDPRIVVPSKFNNLKTLNERARIRTKISNKEATQANSWFYNSAVYKRYKQYQKIVWLILQESRGSYLSTFVYVAILAAVIVSLAKEIVMNSVVKPEKTVIWLWIDEFTSGIFIAEFFMRLFSTTAFGDSITTYIFRPLFLVDLVAILPPILERFHEPDLEYGSLINYRVLVFIRILRVLKLTRYIKHATVFVEGVKKSLASFGFLFLLLIIANFCFATIIYYAELSDEHSRLQEGIPIAMWWAVVTISTAGYGDVVPSTPQGKVIASLAAVFGNLLLTLPVVILGYNFQEVYTTRLEEKKIAKLKQTQSTNVGDFKNMTSEQKEVFFMKQRISSIEEMNKKVMSALNNSESIYQKVSIDLKDLFRSVYAGIDDNQQNDDNSSAFDKKIKVMERLAKAKRKIKLVHVFRKTHQKDSESSHMKTEKGESPLKIRSDKPLIRRFSVTKEDEQPRSDDSLDFDGYDEEIPNIRTTHRHISKARKHLGRKEEYELSTSSSEEPQPLFDFSPNVSVMMKEKTKRERSRLFEPLKLEQVRPQKTIFERTPSTYRPNQTPTPTQNGEAENLFCIKSHSQDNINTFLKYRNERLKFLDNKTLNQILKDMGEFDDMTFYDEQSSRNSNLGGVFLGSGSVTNRRIIPQKLSFDIRPPTSRRTTRNHTAMTTRRFLINDDEE